MAMAIEHITLKTPDISCGHCVSAIQNRLGELEGVSSVIASAETKQVAIDFDPAKISLATIKNELDDEGYPVSE
ncbi:MAG TPA: cation transporter [Thermomicrobiales bacterium]|nr:cation transporter [Thermomicrobiales bacterium]